MRKDRNALEKNWNLKHKKTTYKCKEMCVICERQKSFQKISKTEL